MSEVTEVDEITFETLTRGPALYTPAEIARLLRVHPRTVLNWVHSGRLSAIRLSPRVYRITRAAMVKYLFPERIRHLPVRRTGPIPPFGRGEQPGRTKRAKIPA